MENVSVNRVGGTREQRMRIRQRRQPMISESDTAIYKS